VRSSPKENQSLEVKVKGISEMEFSLSIFDYTFTNYYQRLVTFFKEIFFVPVSPFRLHW
jgi:sporulation-control protein spo0M